MHALTMPIRKADQATDSCTGRQCHSDVTGPEYSDATCEAGFGAAPVASLDKIVLKKELDAIGQQTD